MEKKNQTEKRILKKIQNQPNKVKGVGLFVVKFRGRLIKEIKGSLTYKQALSLGESSLAFKFIPYGENITVEGKTYKLNSINSIPTWKCVAKCSSDIDCKHISEVCICTQGECL